MSNKGLSSSYLGVGYNFDQQPRPAGDILVCPSDIKEENILRIVSDSVVGDYIIKGSLIGQTDKIPLYVGTGTVDTTIDITLYDRLFIESSSPLTSGQLAVSAFLTPNNVSMSLTGGDATAANQVVANDLLSQVLAELTRDVNCAETPELINLNITVANSIFMIDLPLDCKRFSIRHRDRGRVEFAFESSLATHFTIPKGNTFSESGLCLVNRTIYLRADKTGAIEVIAWT